MNVILLKDVEKLGHRGEVVNVARGYARNYLLPRNLAEVATEGRVKEVQRIDAQKAMHEARSAEQAAEIAATLGKLVLRFDVKSGPTGSLFGSVTTTDIADEMGRKNWGFPKFVADIQIDRTEDSVKCEVLEKGERILGVEIHKPAPSKPFGMPLRLYSTLGEEMLFTQLHVDVVGSIRRRSLAAHLEIAPHARTRDLDPKALEGVKPIEVRWFDEYRTLLDRPSIRYRLSA